ncbi:MAG: maleylpyruvate isomerase N-terminal domain-containing protein, partial [Nocardioides sp.]
MTPGERPDLDPQGAFELLPEATQRLVRTVDGLEDRQLAEPSGLPGWTRAHVVAHLALNAEGLAAVLTGRIEGEPTTMYISEEARTSEIEELARADRAELRERFLAGTTLVADAVDRLPDEFWTETFERTPGGR